MPIRQFLEDGSFSPEAVIAMTAAFDAALKELRLVDRNDPLAEIVAHKIINLARTGERDSRRLCERALKDIRS